MNGKHICLCIGLSLLISTASPGQQSELNQLGTSMANFLKIGVGARASAMGDAYVALADDISSLYWNPGGLATLQRNEVMFYFSDWLLDTKVYFFGASFRLGHVGVFGFSINTFSSGEIQETTIMEPEGTGRTFSAGDFSAGLTYSRQITDRFSAGITLKYIRESLDRENASTVAIDLGSVFVTDFLNNLRIGFAMSNLGGRMQLEGTDLALLHLQEPGVKYVRTQLGTEPWDIPLLFRFGIATDMIRQEDYRLTVSSEVMDSRDFGYRISTGGEVAFKEMIFLRGGYRFKYDETDLALGFGLKLPDVQGFGLKFDYAYEDFGILNQIQKFSLILMY
ncbi:MAG: PorV/PorQ family protein [bacterium]